MTEEEKVSKEADSFKKASDPLRGGVHRAHRHHRFRGC